MKVTSDASRLVLYTGRYLKVVLFRLNISSTFCTYVENELVLVLVVDLPREVREHPTCTVATGTAVATCHVRVGE